MDAQQASRALRAVIPGSHKFNLYLRIAVDIAAAYVEKPTIQALATGLRPALEANDPRRIVMDYREILTPHLRAVSEAVVRVSLLGDPALKDAAGKVADAIGDLIAAVGAKEKEYCAHEKALTEAVGMLRRTLDVDPERRHLRRSKRRKQIAARAQDV